MDYSIKELRQKTKEIIDLVDQGKSITITYRGQRKARVVALDRRPTKIKIGFGMWSDNLELRDSSAVVRETRRGRNEW